VVSNGGLFPSSGFPNSPRPQLPASHFSQLQLSADSTNAAISHHPPTFLNAFSRLSRNDGWFSLFSLCTDRTKMVSSIITCSFVAGEITWSQSCSPATDVVLSLYSCYLAMDLHVIIFIMHPMCATCPIQPLLHLITAVILGAEHKQ
jgi:hypothetical protein